MTMTDRNDPIAHFYFAGIRDGKEGFDPQDKWFVAVSDAHLAAYRMGYADAKGDNEDGGN
jgi:hypothetical protein